MTIQQKLDSFSMVLADNIRANDQMIKQFEQLQKEVTEMQQQPMNANWYDFTEEQKHNLSKIVSEFIDKLIGDHLRSKDVFLSEGAIEVNVEIDLRDLVNEALPYNIDDRFEEYLNDEITEQREEQQQDC